jgi:hypothetical protein
MAGYFLFIILAELYEVEDGGTREKECRRVCLRIAAHNHIEQQIDE